MSDNILVAVRLRPLILREKNESLAVHWQIFEDNTIVQIDSATNKALCAPYRFDRVYGMDYNNSDIYFEIAEGIVESALAGFNGTIFAYGQTSSGKTFTMMGDKQAPGIIPLAIQNIFQSIENNPNREYLIRVSYMEIYNETITDLLSGREQKGKGLTIREDASGAVYVVDLKEECVNSEEMLLSLMKRGNKNRHVGITNMNDQSSRSHTIFRLIIESRERSEGNDTEEAITVSHLNLVDLAGSENASQTGATGERLKEGGFINKSLFMLGRVISQLSEGEQYINFRDSKLTRILQLSLGGNAKTAIVCTVTPVGIEQTHSTLRFASRAKSVKNKPIVNEVLSDAALLKRYAKEIKNLQSSLQKERNTDKAQEVEQVLEMLDEKERRNQELLQKINELKTKLVVSSHPRETSKERMNKKKLRRETWAAPAVLRAMRMSMAPPRIEPIKIDRGFLHPKLPPWTESPSLPDSPFHSQVSDVNTSVMSDGFGKDFSFSLAEQSQLEKLDCSSVKLKPWKHVHFNLLDREDVVDAECQTEESFMPHLRLTVEPSIPGTPVHILRSRNRVLKEEVSEKEQWIKECQEEVRELSDFQKNEIRLLEESFQLKAVQGPINFKEDLKSEDGDSEKELKDLKQSLSDSEGLLLDCNKSLAQRSQEVFDLQEQVKQLSLKSSRLEEVEHELQNLRHENEKIQKAMDEKLERLNQLENERKDFDVMMELAVEKQRVKESDLRRSLDDAWQEIAALEKDNVEEVKKRHQRLTILESELQLAQESISASKDESNLEDLKKQLEDAHAQHQAYKQQVEENILQPGQVSLLEAKVKEMEAQVSEIEILRTELFKAESQMKSLKVENKILKEESLALPLQISFKENVNESRHTSHVESEVDSVHGKFEGDIIEGLPGTPLDTSSSSFTSKISRKLSETLQVLEETMMVPCTPGKDSPTLSDTFIHMHDFALIKQQLLSLQEALVAQELQYPNQKLLEESAKEAATDQRISSEIIAQVETETKIWKLMESFCGDYLSHAVPVSQNDQYTRSDLVNRRKIAILNRKSAGFPDIEKILAETRADVIAEYEERLSQERATLETRMNQNSFVEYDTLYFSPGDTTSIASMDLTLNSGMAEMSATDDKKDIVQSLEEKVQLLTKENSKLVSQVVNLQKELADRDCTWQEHKSNDNVGHLDGSIVLPSKPVDEVQSLASELQEAGMSLADEFHKVGMGSTFCNDTFETSVLDLSPDTNQEHQILTQRVQSLDNENCSLKNQILLLQKECELVKKQLEREESEADTPTKNATIVKELEENLRKVQEDKDHLEETVNKLQDKVDDCNITDEEVRCLRWQVDSLKEEKYYLEDELKGLEFGEDVKVCSNEKKKEGDGESVEVHDHLKCEENLRQLMVELEEIREVNKDITKEKEGLAMEHDNDRKLLDAQITTLRNEMDLKSCSYEKMKEELVMKEHQHKTTEEDLESVKASFESQVKAVQEAEETCEILKQKLNEKTQELEKACLISKELEGLKAKMEDEKKNNETCLQTPEEEQLELRLANEKIESLTVKLENQQKSSESKIASVIDEKDAELESVITNFMEKEDALESRIKDLMEANKCNGDFEVQMEDWKQKCSLLQIAIDNLESSNVKKDTELSALLETLQKLENDLLNVRNIQDEELQVLRETIVLHEAKQNGYLNDLEALNKKCDEAQAEMLTLVKEKMHIQQDLDAALFSIEETKLALQNKEAEIEKLSLPCNERNRYDGNEFEDTVEREIMLKRLDELEEIKTELDSKTVECNKLKDALDNLEILKMKNEVMFTNMNEEHHLEVKLFNESLEEKDKHICTIESEIKAKAEEVTSLCCALKAKESKIDHLLKELDVMKHNNTRCETECENLIMSVRKEMSEKVQELEVEAERLNKLYEEVCDDRKKMLESLNYAEQSSKDLLSANDSMKDQLEKNQKELISLQEQLDSKDAELRGKIDEVLLLDAERQKLREELSDLKKKETQLQDICDVNHLEIGQKTEQLLLIEAEQEKKEREVIALSLQVEELSKEQKQSSDHIANLIGIIEKLERDVIAKEDQVNCALRWKEEVSDKEEKVKGLEVKIETLQSENDEMKKIHSKLEKDLTNSEKKAEGLEVKYENLIAAKEEVVHTQSKLESELAVCKKELLLSAAEKEELVLKLSVADQELHGARSEYMSGSEILKGLQSELMEKTVIVEELIDKKDTLVTELKSLKNELNSMIELEKVSKDKLMQQNKEITTLKENMEQQEEHYRALEKLQNVKVGNLQKIIEKYETEASENQAQLLLKEEKLESLAMELENKKLKMMEAQESVDVLLKEKADLVQKQSSLERIISDLKVSSIDVSSCKCSCKEMDTEELQKRLSDAEVKLKNVEEELQKALAECEIKREECCKLDAEMDDLVEYYKKQQINKSEVIESLTSDCKKMEEELMETKEKLTLSHLTVDFTSMEDDHAHKPDLDETVKILKEDLEVKGQECLELNKEMDDMVKHYKVKEDMYCKELEEVTKELEKTQVELKENKLKLQEVSLIEKSLMTTPDATMTQKTFSALSSNEEDLEIKGLKELKSALEHEHATLETLHLKLKGEYNEMEEKYLELKQSNQQLQEEIGLGSSTIDDLLEKLGDLEKFKVFSLQEKEGLLKMIKDFEEEVHVLKKTSADQSASEQIDDLLHRIKNLEKELEILNKNFEKQGEECSGWKEGYTKVFEECEELREKIRNAELQLGEEKVNKSSSDSSVLNISKCGRKSKLVALEDERDALLTANLDLYTKSEKLEKHLASIRKSSGVVSTVEEFQLELSLMQKKQEEVEKERDLLNKNYDLLEKDFEMLQKELESRKSNQNSAPLDVSTMEQLQRENGQLQEELHLLKECVSLKTRNVSEEDSTEGSTEDRIVVLERENNELRFRLKALNAPAEKEAQSLKVELSNANAKVNHLKAELRRIQNSMNADSTICEINRPPVCAKMFDSEEASSDPKFDYNCKSGVVSEVQVMILQNKVYHLEKENKKMTGEHNAMEQHVQHYKSKAQEWKDTALKERKHKDKLKMEAETWRSESSKLQKQVEEGKENIERQCFEIGSQREFIEKLEREKMGQDHLDQISPTRDVGKRNNVLSSVVKAQETDSTLSQNEEIRNSKLDLGEEAKPHLRMHNIPLPSQTRTERLPFAKDSSDGEQFQEGKQPLWCSSYKENKKDYSKYRLPPGSSKKKDEDCKTQ